jgi:hypothetical protein
MASENGGMPTHIDAATNQDQDAISCAPGAYQDCVRHHAPTDQSDLFKHMFSRLSTVEYARDVSMQERQTVFSTFEQTHVYGEIGPEALFRVFRRFENHGLRSRSGSDVPSSFLDVGSGAGKPLIGACMMGFHSAVGVEILASLHELCKKNIAIYQRSSPKGVIKPIHGDALLKSTYVENDLHLENVTHVFCNSTMFSEHMMNQLSILPFQPGTLFCTTTNKLDDARWEEIDSWSEESSGNWGGKTTFFLFEKRTKREALIRLTAKKMSGIK